MSTSAINTAPPEGLEADRDPSLQPQPCASISDPFCRFLEGLIDLFDKAIARQDEHLARIRAEADYYASLSGRR